MANITHNVGEAYIGGKVFVDGELQLGLYTNDPATLDETTVLGDLVEPSGAAYARVTLNSWTAGGNSTHPQVSFTPSGGSWTGVRGAFIAVVATGELLVSGDRAGSGDDVADGQPYQVNPSALVD